MRGQSEGLPTDRTFTGQRAETGLGSLMDYGARFYSPLLGRFLSADTIVPKFGSPMSLNRYMYVLGNPIRLLDPTGHWENDADLLKAFGYSSWDDPDWQKLWQGLPSEWQQMLRSKDFTFGTGLTGEINGQTRTFMVANIKGEGKAGLWELTDGSIGNYNLGLQSFFEQATSWAAWKDSGDGGDAYPVYKGAPDLGNRNGMGLPQPVFDPHRHLTPFGDEGWKTQLVVAQDVNVGQMFQDVGGAVVGLGGAAIMLTGCTVTTGGTLAPACAEGGLAVLGGFITLTNNQLFREGGWITKRTPIILPFDSRVCAMSPVCSGTTSP